MSKFDISETMLISDTNMTLENKTMSNIDLDSKLRTKASSSRMLLFYQFQCPHCRQLNVYAKNYKREIVLCSSTGCKKMIIIDNFKDIA